MQFHEPDEIIPSDKHFKFAYIDFFGPMHVLASFASVRIPEAD
jgi:hypothetical protein